MSRELPRPPDDELLPAPEGLRPCDQCGEFYGWALFLDPPEDKTRSPGLARCLCEGIVCRHCKTTAIHRPVSNYYDEESDTLWHVPWHRYLMPCADCRRREAAA